MKLQIKNNFNKAANCYDNSAKIQLESSIHLAKICSSNIKIQPKTIIDIGCGTGSTTLEFLKFYKDADCTICDIAENMINVAIKKTNPKSSIICDAETYDFQDYYDLGVSNLTLQWFENIDLFINKIMKRCKYFAFSILTENSLLDYANLFDVSPTFNYPSIDKLKSLFGLKYHDFKVYDIYFDNAFFAAKHFKDIGANTPSNQDSSRVISRLLKHNQKIKLNYNVFFAIISGDV